MKISIFTYIGAIFFVLNFHFAHAQILKGNVSMLEENSSKSPLIAANVYWLNQTKGTTTDENGNFEIKKTAENKRLIISYVGFYSDTLLIGKELFVEIILKPNAAMKDVVIRGDKTLEIEPMQAEVLTIKDLRKAACCNLSESFETNASVEVGQADAISGNKQLKMLGLDGIYAQIMLEKKGFARGLLTRNGMNFIPGTWLKSVDINKGAGSVVDGYESVTGQINAELAKPENSEKWLFNLYANQGGRIELNSNHAHKLSEKWSTALLLHGSQLKFDNDGNNDGFLDIPKYDQINVLNRWKYQGENMEAQFGAHYVYDDRRGGRKEANWNQKSDVNLPYNAGSTAKSINLWTKTGFLSQKVEGRSLGLIFSGTQNQLSSFWGLNSFEGAQKNINATAIFQTPIGKKDDLKIGLSYIWDNYSQVYTQKISFEQTLNQNREEQVAGIFGEYTFSRLKNFTAVLGLRADKHNLYGNFFNPRLHLKYDLSENTFLRFSAGRGMRVANVFVENAHFLASSRKVILQDNLRPEIAWNTGGSFSHKFEIAEREGLFILDFYHTKFENQIITDLDSKEFTLSFYNLSGKSFANSFQAEVKYEVFNGFNANFAYKYYDIQTSIGGELREMPFVSKHRGFVNFAYETRNEKWLFDLTTHYFGSKRLPETSHWSHDGNKRTDGYFIVHAQITRNWEKLSLYVGVENLNNFMQMNPIVSSSDAYSEKFDAGMIWAPIMGRMTYMGLRYTIK